MGEKGKSAGESISSSELSLKRVAETESAAAFLGFSYVFLGYPDGELCLIDQAELLRKLLVVLRILAPAALISFHPHEITSAVHHEDHREVGKLTSLASTLLDVSGYTVTDETGREIIWDEQLVRSDLWFWYSRLLLLKTKHLQKNRDVVVFKQSKKDKQNQVSYLADHHSSQAPKGSKKTWKRVVHTAAYNPSTNRCEESYLIVRNGTR